MKLYELVKGDKFVIASDEHKVLYTSTGNWNPRTRDYNVLDERGNMYHIAGHTPVLFRGVHKWLNESTESHHDPEP